MNLRAKALFVAIATASAASSLHSVAADQSAYVDEQSFYTDGYPQHLIQPNPARLVPATPHQVAMNKWLEAQRSASTTPFPVPDRAPASQVAKAPETPYQAEENGWLAKQRSDVTDGN